MSSSEGENSTTSSGFRSAAGKSRPGGSEQRWRLERLIAEGGTSHVHQAFDTVMERRVALKVMKPELAKSRKAVDLFLQEPRVAARLPHPHIVPIFDVGRDSHRGPFFTMKLVVGRQLEEVIRDPAVREWGPVHALPLVDVFCKICDALAFAHSRGVVHADLKPENVRVGEFGQVYLMDWGMARVVDYDAWATDPNSGSDEPDSLSSRVMVPGVSGTPAYMAPEMLLGESPGMRTDVFAAGVTLYWIATRERPFGGATLLELVGALRRGDFVPPRETHGGAWIPPELERIVQKALAVDPAQRYADATALAADLRALTRVGAHFPVVEFAAGDQITRAGESPDAAYVILDGRCGVYADADADADGGSVLLDTLGPGDVCGADAILADGGVSPASTVALEPTSASRLTRETAEQEVSALAPWVGKILAAMTRRNRSAVTQRIRARQAVSFLARKGIAGGGRGKLLGADRAALARHLSSSRLLAAFAEGATPAKLLDLTCEYVFDSFRSIVPFDRLGVALLEDGTVVRLRWSRQDYEGETLAPGYSAPLAGSSLSVIAETCEPRIIEDLREYLAEHPHSVSTRRILDDGVRSSLTCPLVAADGVLGFLFFSSREPGAYRAAHVDAYLRLAESVSALVAAARAAPEGRYGASALEDVGRALLEISAAVENARDEVRILTEVSRRSRRGAPLEEILDYIYESFRGVVPYDRIGYASLEEGGQVARARWARSEGHVVGIPQDYRASIQHSSLRYVLLTGRPRILDDLVEYLAEHPQSHSTRLIVKEGMQSSLTCPLVSMGSPVGFLFFSSRMPRTYDAAHVEAFEHIAEQLAGAIERADVNRALLEARAEIARRDGESS